MADVILSREIEERGKDKYGTPAASVRVYVARAITELGRNNGLVNDMESAMYAWRLPYQEGNVDAAREILKMQDANLSELARAMADADETTRNQIENDPRYHILPPTS